MRKVKKKGCGEEPPNSPTYYFSYIHGSLYLHSPFEKKKEKNDLNVPQLKLDIKFELPMYNGELNAEQLDNWICQIEVYCRIQKFTKDDIKIHLDSLRLGETTLIWWERRSQEDLATKGKIIPLGMSSFQHLKKILSIRVYTASYDGLAESRARLGTMCARLHIRISKKSIST